MAETIKDPSAPYAELDLPPQLPVQLDWMAYYEAFKEAHGEPVRHKGRLLFPDGWTYSLKDRAGPEWPPPKDPAELEQLNLSYWLIRLRMVQNEYRVLKDMVHSLREMQRVRTVPLMVRQPFINDDGRLAYRPVPIDLDGLEQGRLAWLEQDVQECQIQLAALNQSRRMYGSTHGGE